MSLFRFVIASNFNQTLLRAAYSFPTKVAINFSTGIPRQFSYLLFPLYRGFKEETLDEYDMALAARYMRMSVFVTLTAWLCYVVARPSVYEQIRLAIDRMFRLGVYSAGWLTLVLLGVALVLTTAYFLIRWIMLRFFKM